MKCRKCTQRAAVNMRQHKLALCGPHFIEWVQQQTERTIHKNRMFSKDDRILVAVSGGKDSLALWDMLLDMGYQADGLYIGLGINGGVDYSDESYAYIKQFMEQRGGDLKLHYVDVEALYGASIPEASTIVSRRGRRNKPCSMCGLSKRHVMNRVARDEGYDVLATGHNLDDEAATLFGNTLTWSVGYLQRQGPVLPASTDGLARKVKPLFRFYEREMAAYVLLKGIDYMYDECPYSVGATSIKHKELLNELETTSPGTKLRFYQGFLRMREEHGLFQPEDEQIELYPCPTCGQPSSNADRCSFCKTWDRIRAGKASEMESTNT